jgi:hypothetical protein
MVCITTDPIADAIADHSKPVALAASYAEETPVLPFNLCCY